MRVRDRSRTDEKNALRASALSRLATRTRCEVGCLGWIRTTTSLTQNQEAYRLADQAKSRRVRIRRSAGDGSVSRTHQRAAYETTARAAEPSRHECAHEESKLAPPASQTGALSRGAME